MTGLSVTLGLMVASGFLRRLLTVWRAMESFLIVLTRPMPNVLPPEPSFLPDAILGNSSRLQTT